MIVKVEPRRAKSALSIMVRVKREKRGKSLSSCDTFRVLTLPWVSVEILCAKGLAIHQYGRIRELSHPTNLEIRAQLQDRLM